MREGHQSGPQREFQLGAELLAGAVGGQPMSGKKGRVSWVSGTPYRLAT